MTRPANSRVSSEQSDTLTLLWSGTLLASFVCLAVDLRLCAIVAALGVFSLLYVRDRQRNTAE